MLLIVLHQVINVGNCFTVVYVWPKTPVNPQQIVALDTKNSEAFLSIFTRRRSDLIGVWE